MKKLLIGVGVLVVIVVLAIAALPFLVDVNRFRPRLESELTTALGREVKVGSLSLNLFGGTISADELTVADDRKFSTTPFLHARSLKLTVDLWALISNRKLNILGLLIDQPEIALIQSVQGDWNFSGIGGSHPPAGSLPCAPAASGVPQTGSTAPGQAPATGAAPTPVTAPAAGSGSSSPLDFSVQLIRVTGAKLAFSQLGGPVKPQALESMDAEIRNFSPTTSFPFSMSAKLASGGDIHMDGKAGPMNPADAAETQVEINLKISSLQLVASGMVKKDSGIDGVLSVEGTGSSDGKALSWNGKVRVEKLKLAKAGKPDTRPVEFDFALRHSVASHSGTLTKGDIHLGNAPAHVTGTYAEKGDVTSVKMRLNGTGMPVSELLSLLPPLDIQLPAGTSLQGGTAGVDATVEGPLTAITGDASVNVNNTKLTGFDLGTKLNFIEKLAGIKPSPDTVIESLSAKVHDAPEGQTVQSLALVIPAIGNLDGAGTISAAHALDFKMRATVHTSGMLMTALGQKGDTAVPFFIQGTSDNPVFKPDVKGIASEQLKKLQSPDAIRKGVGILGGLLGGRKQ